MKKYTFVEFVAAWNSIGLYEDGYSFDNIDPSWLDHWKEHLHTIISGDQIHDGDCTSQPHSCELCMMKMLLEDYYQYYFQEEQWRKNNLNVNIIVQ